MKIAVLSDTHGNYTLALKILDLLGEIDLIIHLGDISGDAELIELVLGCKPVMVSGNCDMTGNHPRQALLDIAGKKIFMTHGDRYHVKSGLAGLCSKAKTERADIVLYGHTHIPHIEEEDGILFINPGTLKEDAKRKSVAVLHISGNKAWAEIIEADRITCNQDNIDNMLKR